VKAVRSRSRLDQGVIFVTKGLSNRGIFNRPVIKESLIVRIRIRESPNDQGDIQGKSKGTQQVQ
jgi:hypothetical protein